MAVRRNRAQAFWGETPTPKCGVCHKQPPACSLTCSRNTVSKLLIGALYTLGSYSDRKDHHTTNFTLQKLPWVFQQIKGFPDWWKLSMWWKNILPVAEEELIQSHIMPVLLLQNTCTLLPSNSSQAAMEISNTTAMRITPRTTSLHREQQCLLSSSYRTEKPSDCEQQYPSL